MDNVTTIAPDQHDETKTVAKKPAKAAIGATEDMSAYTQMVEDMPIAVMTCDLETFVITYMNKASLAALKTLEHVLPVKADQMVGQCIDIFYENPAHQRQMLANPANMPHNAMIKLGDETLNLSVSALTDQQGN